MTGPAITRITSGYLIKKWIAEQTRTMVCKGKGGKDMAGTKKETVLHFFNENYDEYRVGYRRNAITESYDFIINTGKSRIFLKIGQKRWDESNKSSIIDFLESKEEQIREVVLDDQNAILRMN